jgi:galactokinase
MSDFDDPVSLFTTRFGDGRKPDVVAVPGRVNLIGEHIDYHNLPVLPMAIGRKIRVAFRARTDRVIRACSSSFGEREFEWTKQLMPSESGDWVNYVKAAAQAVEGRWKLKFGIDATVVSDLPPAAGLSSSSALLTGFTLALLRANGVQATFEELMDVLPEGEYFVGTRGGGMDHAAVLAGRRGCAILVNFAPLAVSSVPVPEGWVFLIAHSLTTAEKSGDVRSKYNARRTAGSNALHGLGFHSFGQALERYSVEELSELAAGHLADDEQRCFLHVVTEAHRVTAAVAAMRAGDAESFGRLLIRISRQLARLAAGEFAGPGFPGRSGPRGGRAGSAPDGGRLRRLRRRPVPRGRAGASGRGHRRTVLCRARGLRSERASDRGRAFGGGSE